jgi:hypothetical protein
MHANSLFRHYFTCFKPFLEHSLEHSHDLPLRIEFPGGLYHITSRGDRREDIFLDERDRLYWLELLG